PDYAVEEGGDARKAAAPPDDQIVDDAPDRKGRDESGGQYAEQGRLPLLALLEPGRAVVLRAPDDGGKALGHLAPHRRKQRACAPLEKVAREDLVAHHRDAVDHLLGAHPGELRGLDRAVERTGEGIEARTLRGDGGGLGLVLRRWPEPLDLALHLGKLRPQG